MNYVTEALKVLPLFVELVQAIRDVLAKRQQFGADEVLAAIGGMVDALDEAIEGTVDADLVRADLAKLREQLARNDSEADRLLREKFGRR